MTAAPDAAAQRLSERAGFRPTMIDLTRELDAGARRARAASGMRLCLGAVDVALSADDLREIEEVSARIEIHGARYPDAHERLTGR